MKLIFNHCKGTAIHVGNNVDVECRGGCREEYYGLRVRQVKDPSVAINIPVSTTIGPSGPPLTLALLMHAAAHGVQGC